MPLTIPIIQKGILSVILAIYLASLFIFASGHARDINSHR